MEDTGYAELGQRACSLPILKKMLTIAQILETERVMNKYTQKIHQTFHKRRESDGAWQEWSDTCRAVHRIKLPTDFLWSDEHRDKVRSGDREAIDDTIVYLEADPWYFRSGYLKEWLLDNLRKAPLNEENKSRLRKVILNVAAGRNRREFRRYCLLAKKVTNEDFERTVKEKAEARIAGNCGKFERLWTVVGEGN